MTYFSLKLLFRDWWVSRPFLIGLAVLLFIWVYIPIKVHFTTDPVFLHYSIFYGVDSEGPWWRLLLPPALATLFWLINGFFACYIFRSDKTLARFVAIFTALVLVLLTCGVVAIVGINT